MNTETITETEEVHDAVPVSSFNAPIKFSVSDSAIAEMKSRFMNLTIAGPTDKTGFQAVHDARMIVKGSRVDVDKKRKQLNEDALAHQRKVNGEAKRLTDLLEVIETHLEKEEKAYNDERDRIAEQKAAEQRQRYQNRVLQLKDMKFVFDDFFDAYHLGEVFINKDDIRDLSEEEYATTFSLAQKAHETEMVRLAEVQRVADEKATALLIEQKAEQDRQDAIALQNKQETDRLQAIADQQKADQKAIDDARLQLEADRRQMIIDQRSPQLIDAGFDWNGSRYKLLNVFRLGVDDIIDMTDGQFADLLIDAKAKMKEAADQEADRVKAVKKAADDKKKADKERTARLAPDKKILHKFFKSVASMKVPDGLSEKESTDILYGFSLRIVELTTEFTAMVEVL